MTNKNISEIVKQIFIIAKNYLDYVSFEIKIPHRNWSPRLQSTMYQKDTQNHKLTHTFLASGIKNKFKLPPVNVKPSAKKNIKPGRRIAHFELKSFCIY